MLKQISLILIASFMLFGASFRSIAQVTPADYQRADSIIKLNDLVYHQINSVNWIDSTSTFWYQVKTRDGAAFSLVDAAKLTRKPSFDVARLVDQLNKQPGVKTTPKSVQFQKLKFDLKANKFQFLLDKTYWTCNLKTYTLTKDSVAKPEGPRPYWNDNFDELGNKPVVSPDSAWVAFHQRLQCLYSEPKRTKKKFS